jgi:hypothetical protein
METISPRPDDYDGFWFLEINRKRGVVRIARVDRATWFEELGDLQFVDIAPVLHTHEAHGEKHIAMSLTVGEYGPGLPTWRRFVDENPEIPALTRAEWVGEKLGVEIR